MSSISQFFARIFGRRATTKQSSEPLRSFNYDAMDSDSTRAFFEGIDLLPSLTHGEITTETEHPACIEQHVTAPTRYTKDIHFMDIRFIGKNGDIAVFRPFSEKEVLHVYAANGRVVRDGFINTDIMDRLLATYRLGGLYPCEENEMLPDEE